MNPFEGWKTQATVIKDASLLSSAESKKKKPQTPVPINLTQNRANTRSSASKLTPKELSYMEEINKLAQRDFLAKY